MGLHIHAFLINVIIILQLIFFFLFMENPKIKQLGTWQKL